ncbi:MAG: zinc ribbon domain-containing protein [Clostridia bacterium]|nr:zinc ribbon domain-containing protein [Clostridia bacterium]
MFCPKCGHVLEGSASFCEHCGNAVSGGFAGPPPVHPGLHVVPPSAPPDAPAAPPTPRDLPPAQPLPPPYAAPVYTGTPPVPPPKKKRRTGCLILVLVAVAVLGAAVWFALSLFGVLKPRDLGVRYTPKDVQSAMDKIGTEVTFEGKSGDALAALSKDYKKSGEKLAVEDYVWTHSDYQEKSFTLTSAEATALLNEIAPAFWWFEDQQIRVLPGGRIEASGTGLLEKALDDLYPELREEVPFPVFEKVNLYARGEISITENRLELDADEFRTGPIEGVSADKLNENADLFEALYTSVPGLVIHSLEVTQDGQIAVSALIPQKTEITRK